MKAWEGFKISIEALRLNRVRSALTMLGIIIGVMAVILLVAIGQGAKDYITKELRGLGTNLLIVTPGKTATKGGFHPPMSGTVRKLIYDDALAIKRRCSKVNDTAPVVMGTGKVKYFNLSRDAMILGVTPEFETVRNLHVEIGSFVKPEDVDLKNRVVVLGRKVKTELFGEANPLGKMVTISDARYRVIGIMEKKGMSLGFDIDDLVFIPVKSAQELFNIDSLIEIIVSVNRAEDLDKATEQIREVLIKRHNKKEDFTIISQEAMLSTMNTILNVMTSVLGGIAAISLIVGGIGIMNIMLVSVRERTREIGIRKAVGARNRDILAQFLMESIALSVAGGMIGIILGIGGALAFKYATEYIPAQVTVWSIVLAFGFSAGVGIFFGVYPARKASLLDPIQALRFE
ncbi:MAG: FtsX-like permease family protein [Desulfobacteraceae bacterium]|nr:MAG: FtsX-like permease family protein [Desulfobacteraceae bacterium]